MEGKRWSYCALNIALEGYRVERRSYEEEERKIGQLTAVIIALPSCWDSSWPMKVLSVWEAFL